MRFWRRFRSWIMRPNENRRMIESLEHRQRQMELRTEQEALRALEFSAERVGDEALLELVEKRKKQLESDREYLDEAVDIFGGES